MTNENYYDRLQDTASYDKLTSLVNHIAERVPLEPTRTERSILTDVEMDSLSRSGVHVKGPRTYAPFEYERPELTIHIAGCFDSETDRLKEISGRVSLAQSNKTLRFTIEDSIFTTLKVDEHSS